MKYINITKCFVLTLATYICIHFFTLNAILFKHILLLDQKIHKRIILGSILVELPRIDLDVQI